MNYIENPFPAIYYIHHLFPEKIRDFDIKKILNRMIQNEENLIKKEERNIV